MKKIILFLLLSFTIGTLYAQGRGSSYIVNWEEIGSIYMQYPQVGNNMTFNFSKSDAIINIRFSKYVGGDSYEQNRMTNYIMQGFSHIPYLNIEYISYNESGYGGTIELYLSENKEGTSRKISIDGGESHIIIVQAES